MRSKVEDQHDFDSLWRSKMLYFGIDAIEKGDIARNAFTLFDRATAVAKRFSSESPLVKNPCSAEIGGKKWDGFQFEGEKQGIKFDFVVYTYGGPEGAYLIMWFTNEMMFAENQKLFENIAKTFRFSPTSSNGSRE
jgi:hypothetical protein